jgi:WD40 repeat protein
MKISSLLLICSIILVACQPKLHPTTIIDEPSYSAILSSNSQYLLISTAHSNLQLWDLSDKTQKYHWFHGKNNEQAIDTAISHNLKYAASLSRDSVSLWSIENGHSLGWWSLPATGQSVSLADTGALLVGLTDGSVMSLNPEQDRLIKFLGHTEKVNSVSLSHDGQVALSGANDNQVILWHAQTGQPIHRWQLPSRIIKVTLSNNGKLAFASDSTNQGIIWQTQSGERLSQLNISRRTMNFSAARFTKDDMKLITGTPAREVSFWQVSSGKMLANWRVSRTEHAQIKGAVVYSVAEDNNNRINSFSSNGLLETWSPEQ